VKAALLRGRDHLATGAIGAAADGSVAIAISRGGAPKPYPHTEPNEDAVLGVRGTRGALVAVTDGHWGHRAAELVLERLAALHAEAWTEGPDRGAERWYQEMLATLVELNDAVLAAHSEGQRSRTTLALALLRPSQDLVVTASAGDSHVFQVLGARAVDLGGARGARSFFLGQERVAASALERDVRIALQPLGGSMALVAATDGLSEEAIGVADPEAAVCAAVAVGSAQAPDARAAAAAGALVEAALGAHREHAAGDNVSAAVAWVLP
jgi:hypothetical protein